MRYDTSLKYGDQIYHARLRLKGIVISTDTLEDIHGNRRVEATVKYDHFSNTRTVDLSELARWREGIPQVQAVYYVVLPFDDPGTTIDPETGKVVMDLDKLATQLLEVTPTDSLLLLDHQVFKGCSAAGPYIKATFHNLALADATLVAWLDVIDHAPKQEDE